MFNWRSQLTVAGCFELKSRITDVQVTVVQKLNQGTIPQSGSIRLWGSFFGSFFGEAKKNNIIIRRFSVKQFLFFYFSFALMQKKQKIKAGRMTAPSCRTAMWSGCTTVASAFVMLLLDGREFYKPGHNLSRLGGSPADLVGIKWSHKLYVCNLLIWVGNTCAKHLRQWEKAGSFTNPGTVRQVYLA